MPLATSSSRTPMVSHHKYVSTTPPYHEEAKLQYAISLVRAYQILGDNRQYQGYLSCSGEELISLTLHPQHIHLLP